jgi:hypothetical protein
LEVREETKTNIYAHKTLQEDKSSRNKQLCIFNLIFHYQHGLKKGFVLGARHGSIYL